MLINRALQNSPTMQAARLRISQSQSTVELARSVMGLQATAVAAQNRLRITDKSFSWPYSYSLSVDKTAPVYAEYRWRRGAAEYRSLGPSAPGSPPLLARKRPAGGDRRH
nr:putative outer membrane efflux protein MdtP [Klebsiella pneumoniae]